MPSGLVDHWALGTGFTVQLIYLFLVCAWRISRAMPISRFQHRPIVLRSSGVFVLVVAAVGATEVVLVLVFRTRTVDLFGLADSCLDAGRESAVSFGVLPCAACSGRACTEPQDTQTTPALSSSHPSSFLLISVLIGQCYQDHYVVTKRTRASTNRLAQI